MADPFESRNIRVKRTPESEQILELQVKKPKTIGAGSFSHKVEQVILSSEHDPHKKEVAAVLKHYTFPGRGSEVAGKMFELLIPRISEVHRKMRADGLPVARTLRFDVEQKVSVMTDFNTDDRVALSGLNYSEEIPFQHFSNIPKISKVIQNVLNVAFEAGTKGYKLTHDAYFLLMDKEGIRQPKVVIGDLDAITMDPENKDRYMEYITINANLLNGLRFIENFCNNWVKDSKTRSRYKRRAYELYSKKVEVWKANYTF